MPSICLEIFKKCQERENGVGPLLEEGGGGASRTTTTFLSLLTNVGKCERVGGVVVEERELTGTVRKKRRTVVCRQDNNG